LSGVQVSTNAVSTIPETPIIQNTVLTPTIFYTCPAGKKAKITGFVRCVDRGAAANASFEAGGVVLFIWNTAAVQNTLQNSYITTPEQLTTALGGQNAFFEVTLIAGQTIRGIQNSGTNSQFKINAKVQESPA